MPSNRNLTGLSWCLDTNILDHPDFVDLNRMYELGWIYLQTPDTVHLELSTAQDPAKRYELLDLRSNFSMPMGAHVLGHSQLGLSVFGSDDDQKRLESIHGIIWNGRKPQEDAELSDAGNRAARSRLRDSMIVATTIRYAHNTLVTEDGKLLSASNALALAFPNFRVISIRHATKVAFSAIAKKRKMVASRQSSQAEDNLPKWP